MTKGNGKITERERDEIAILRAKSIGVRAIARKLGRSPSSISDELKRNTFGEYYVAIHAQAKADKRKVEAGKRPPLKNRFVYVYVRRKLRRGWSPEQISGRLKMKYPGDETKHIHFESIYRYIYEETNKDKQLWEYLPRKQKKRKKKYGRKSHRCRIPDRVSIHDRPTEVEDRQVFGHWEGDSIEGKAHKGGIHTQVERKTRYLIAQFINNLTAEETVRAQSQMFLGLPKEALRSTTVDNGKEFTKHKEFELTVYFADPYSSWQRGTNENSNGLIRRYIPKKTDVRKIDQSELDDMIREINNKPKKCLGFRKPQEAFEEELQLLTVRIPKRM